jgi:5-methylcytosine-specific restriction endonuclease McrA
MEGAITKLSSTYHNGQHKARIVEPESYDLFTWDDWSKLRPKDGEGVLRASHYEIRIPEVILLSKYNKIPNQQRSFSRRRLWQRDNFQCMYCGKKPGSEELTVDHVLPRSQGGLTTWENCVLACVKCNTKKANRTPEQAKMKLLTVPKKPKLGNLFRADFNKPIKSWEAFLGECYWTCLLTPQKSKPQDTIQDPLPEVNPKIKR